MHSIICSASIGQRRRAHKGRHVTNGGNEVKKYNIPGKVAAPFYYGGNADENGRELITFRDVLTFTLFKFRRKSIAKSRVRGGEKNGRVARSRIKT